MATEPELPRDFVSNSIDSFRANVVNRGGVQYASKYIVEFYTPFGNYVTYPSEVNIPQRALATYDAGQPDSLWGTKRKVPVQHEFDEVTMSFVIYQDNEDRKFLESWMDNIINKGSYNEDYIEYANVYFDYVGKIYISTLLAGSHDVTTATYLLDEAYPLSILPITLAAENNGYATFVATFAYRKYYIIK